MPSTKVFLIAWHRQEIKDAVVIYLVHRDQDRVFRIWLDRKGQVADFWELWERRRSLRELAFRYARRKGWILWVINKMHFSLLSRNPRDWGVPRRELGRKCA